MGTQNSTTSPGQSGVSNQSGATSSNPNSITGCLGGSAATGVFTLTAQNGTTYTLTGNTDKLRTHVGEQIQVTGQPGATASAAGANP